MEFGQLRHFVTIAEQRNLSRAADIVKVSQGTLSRQMADLERELGTHLFTRTGRGVIPTAAGRRLLEHARGLLLSQQAAVEAVRGLRDPMTSRVSIGIPPSLCELFSVTLYERFTARFPRASLSILQGLSEELYNRIVSGHIDIAVMRNPPISPHLVIEQLAKEPLYLLGAKPIGRRNCAVTLAQLAKVPLILPNVPDATRPILEAIMARAGLTLQIRMEVGATQSMFAMATAGHGYAVIPKSTRAIVPRVNNASWQRLDAPELVTTLSLVIASRAPKTAPFIEVATILKSLVRNLLKRNRS